jgi:hypothetical protein
MITSCGLPRSSTTIFFRIAVTVKPY